MARAKPELRPFDVTWEAASNPPAFFLVRNRALLGVLPEGGCGNSARPDLYGIPPQEASIMPFASVAQGTHSWGYSGATGPDHWAEFSATCRLGKTQSPIDILHAEKKQLSAIEFAYHSSPSR